MAAQKACDQYAEHEDHERRDNDKSDHRRASFIAIAFTAATRSVFTPTEPAYRHRSAADG
jgi:hypothetical protein